MSENRPFNDFKSSRISQNSLWMYFYGIVKEKKMWLQTIALYEIKKSCVPLKLEVFEREFFYHRISEQIFHTNTWWWGSTRMHNMITCFSKLQCDFVIIQKVWIFFRNCVIGSITFSIIFITICENRYFVKEILRRVIQVYQLPIPK